MPQQGGDTAGSRQGAVEQVGAYNKMAKQNFEGEAIRRARVERGISQVAVARAVGVSQWKISRIEGGYIRLPESSLDRILAAIVRLGQKKTESGPHAIFPDLALPSRVEMMNQRRNTLQGKAGAV